MAWTRKTLIEEWCGQQKKIKHNSHITQPGLHHEDEERQPDIAMETKIRNWSEAPFHYLVTFLEVFEQEKHFFIR